MRFPKLPLLLGRQCLSVLVFLLGMTVISASEARDYLVEILIFERKSISGEVEEQWIPGSNSQTENLTELQTMMERSGNQLYQLKIDHLTRLETELRRSDHRILYKASWRQPSAFIQNAPVVPIGSEESSLRGAVRVYKTSLIFVDISLGLDDPLIDPESSVYFIHEKRRVKFKEVHYFDHPKFGVLMTVWPA